MKHQHKEGLENTTNHKSTCKKSLQSLVDQPHQQLFMAMNKLSSFLRTLQSEMQITRRMFYRHLTSISSSVNKPRMEKTKMLDAEKDKLLLNTSWSLELPQVEMQMTATEVWMEFLSNSLRKKRLILINLFLKKSLMLQRFNTQQLNLQTEVK